ncbi:M48 family metallopeptidase [Candidatus Woesearchaeota archaeon]|nr:M48 family metallopeptidase [Candidatus Woesearchaeota archaeon]
MLNKNSITLVEKAFEALYPDSVLNRDVVVKYYKSFKGYNATVKYNSTKLEFHISHLWQDIGDEIKIGLIQVLLLKVYSRKTKVRTLNIDLYEIFLKKVSSIIPKDNQDPLLLASFERMNYHFFNGIMEPCNLVWGKRSTRKFGSYDFSTDCIIMSSIFKKMLPEREYLMDYVMYHEMLHKKLKFDSSEKVRRFYHTKEFRDLERKYPLYERCEQELKEIAVKGHFIGVFNKIFPF